MQSGYTLLSTARVRAGMDVCRADGCDEPAAVRVYVPWEADRDVCTGHARAIVQQDGVVAEPLEGAEEEWR